MWDDLSRLDLILSLTGTMIGLIVFFGGFYVRQHRRLRAAQAELAEMKAIEGQASSELEFIAVLPNVEAVKAKIAELLNAESGSSRPVRVDNLGLDLETIQAMLRYSFSETLIKRPIVYRGLIIDPQSEDIRAVTGGGSNISQAVAARAIGFIRDQILQTHPHIQMSLRSYPNPPAIHGFMLNEEHCFIGFTHFERDGLVGGTTPYLYVSRDQATHFSDTLFMVFDTWFDHLFAHGPDVLSGPPPAALDRPA